MVWVKGPVNPGCKILRVPHPEINWPRERRFYNPNGEEFIIEVAFCAWIQGLVAEQSIMLCADPNTVKETKTTSTKTKSLADKEI
jgi:hypothetical protein